MIKIILTVFPRTATKAPELEILAASNPEQNAGKATRTLRIAEREIYIGLTQGGKPIYISLHNAQRYESMKGVLEKVIESDTQNLLTSEQTVAVIELIRNNLVSIFPEYAETMDVSIDKLNSIVFEFVNAGAVPYTDPWMKVKDLIASNSRHRKKGFNINDVKDIEMLDHVILEIQELQAAPDDIDEMGDIFGPLIQYCHRKGWTKEMVEKAIIRKLGKRFD